MLSPAAPRAPTPHCAVFPAGLSPGSEAPAPLGEGQALWLRVEQLGFVELLKKNGAQVEEAGGGESLGEGLLAQLWPLER